MKKVRYKVRNWREYNRALKNRYSFNLWLNDDVRAAWLAVPATAGKRGAPLVYSDLAIQCCLTSACFCGCRFEVARGFCAPLRRCSACGSCRRRTTARFREEAKR